MTDFWGGLGRRSAGAGLCGVALAASVLLAPVATASDGGPATVGTVSTAKGAEHGAASSAELADGSRVALVNGRDVRIRRDGARSGRNAARYAFGAVNGILSVRPTAQSATAPAA